MHLTAVRTRSFGRPRLRTVAGTVVALAAGIAVGGILLAVAATTLLGYRVLDIASNSMEPALHRGDLILSRPTPIDEVKEGDVIVFQEGERIPILVAHRVAAVVTIDVNATSKSTGVTTTSTSRVFRTKGDANANVDGQVVDPAHYRGVVSLVVPMAGLPLLGFPMSQVFILVAGLTALAWAVYEVSGLVRRRRARRLAPVPEEPAP